MVYDQKMANLALDFFRSFAQFEYCLKVTGYCVAGRGNAANPNWTRFSNEIPSLRDNAGPDVVEAITYIMKHPLKKQVYVDETPQWHDVAPEAENENDLILLYVRRVRNNLFHGGKFNGRFFEPERSRKLLEHSLTILMAALFMSKTVLEAYENRTD